MKIPVLVPWAEGVTPRRAAPASRAPSLQGATVGIVDNGWHCMHVLTDVLSRALTESFGAAGVVIKHTSGSLTLDDDERAELIRDCRAVIVGIGTCGSCTRWVLKDAVALEQAGIPTVSLYTEAFAVLAATLADSEGMPALPRIVLPHPLNPLPVGEIRAIGVSQTEAILARLLAAGGLAAA